MDRPCYCCRLLHKDPGAKENLSELDAALNELGMLSVATESRRQYLHELAKKGCRSHASCFNNRPTSLHSSSTSSLQGGFCVLRMNKNFVTNYVSSLGEQEKCANEDLEQGDSARQGALDGFSASPPFLQTQQFGFEDEKFTRNSHVSSARCPFKVRSAKVITRLRFLKPYEIPWHKRIEERVRTLSWNQDEEELENESTVQESRNCSNGNDSASSANRSNPGSPSKGTRAPTSKGGLVRSRSLDHLTPSTRDQDIGGELYVTGHHKEEIDNMSQQMQGLRVN